MTRRKQDDPLWERVKKTAKPLKASDRFVFTLPDDDDGKLKPPAKMPVAQPSKSSQSLPRPVTREPAFTFNPASKPRLLDEATGRKIAKGRMAIDARLDLHGMTQAQAHFRLYQFLVTAQQLGNRTILVITGKGKLGEGILRSQVPRWLNEPEFKSLASGYREAHVVHGGGGALYIRVRKKERGRS